MIIFLNLLFCLSLISVVCGFILLLVGIVRFKTGGPENITQAYKLELGAAAFWIAAYVFEVTAHLILKFALKI